MQRSFLNKGIQCARLDPFFLTTTRFFSTIIQKMLCILASGWTLAVVLSPPVSFASQLPDVIDPCEVRHYLGDSQALTCSGECQLTRDKLYHRSLSMARKRQQNSGRTTCHLERITKWHAVCPFFAWGNFDVSAESREVCLLETPLTGYEPNVIVEVSSAEVTPTLLPSTRASFGSADNSGEDVTTTPVSSEVDETHTWECWLHHCSCRREQQVQPRQAFITLLEKSSMSRSSHLRCAERRVAMYSHKRKIEQGPKKQTTVLFRKKMNIRGASRSSGLPHVTRRQSSRRRRGSLIKTL